MVNQKNILFKKEYAEQLLQIAIGDLQTAKALIESDNPGRKENILYMIQQSVEKMLKTVLIKKQISFPLVHDLGILIALLPVKDYPPGGFDWTAMNPYASIRRYEVGQIPIGDDEIESAYLAAEQVREWAKSY
jgi:HEPN domain-containing protein